MDIAQDALMRRGVLIRQSYTLPHVFPSQVRSGPRAVPGVLQAVLCCGAFVEGESVLQDLTWCCLLRDAPIPPGSESIFVW